MKTYTLTEAELRAALSEAINIYERDIPARFIGPARDAAVDMVMIGLAGEKPIPFDGSAVAYETEDNISEAELGLQEAM